MEGFYTKPRVVVVTSDEKLKLKGVCAVAWNNEGDVDVQIGVNSPANANYSFSEGEGSGLGSFDQIFSDDSYLDIKFNGSGTKKLVLVTSMPVGWFDTCDEGLPKIQIT
jgi:hypothetical protein